MDTSYSHYPLHPLILHPFGNSLPKGSIHINRLEQKTHLLRNQHFIHYPLTHSHWPPTLLITTNCVFCECPPSSASSSPRSCTPVVVVVVHI